MALVRAEMTGASLLLSRDLAAAMAAVVVKPTL
jgi:hypothetical protein